MEGSALSMNKDKEQSKRPERREIKDRRGMDKSVDFPFKTKEGLIVMKDRRVRPDRRINNIAVDNAEIDTEQFEDVYQKFIGNN